MEIVEQDPGQVSEVWCRKIFRQLLLSLECQYAMKLPHRPITPDTVFIRENGDPILLPTESDPQPELARDLTALAKVMHYAITQGRASTRSLRSLALEGYSDSIITAIDRSLAHEPSKRPHTIDELRALLGIVALREIALVRTARQDLPVHSPQLPLSRALPSQDWVRAVSRRQPWALTSMTAVTVLGVILAVLYSSRDPELRSAISIPQAVVEAPLHKDNGPPAAGTSPIPEIALRNTPRVNLPEGESHAIAAAGSPTKSGHQTSDVASVPTRARQAANRRQEKPVKPARHMPVQATSRALPQQESDPGETAQAVQLPVAPTSNEQSGNVVLDLHIQPWGRVYVDGVARGVSPPMKRMTVTPGRHTILVKNANSSSRSLEVDTARGDRHVTVEFTDESK